MSQEGRFGALSKQDELRRAVGETVQLLTSDPRASVEELRRLRRRALREGNRNDATAILALMAWGARSYDRSLARRIYQRLAREQPDEPRFWNMLARVEADIALFDFSEGSPERIRHYRLAARHWGIAAAKADEVGSERRTDAAEYRELQAAASAKAHGET